MKLLRRTAILWDLDLALILVQAGYTIWIQVMPWACPWCIHPKQPHPHCITYTLKNEIPTDAEIQANRDELPIQGVYVSAKVSTKCKSADINELAWVWTYQFLNTYHSHQHSKNVMFHQEADWLAEPQRLEFVTESQ